MTVLVLCWLLFTTAASALSQETAWQHRLSNLFRGNQAATIPPSLFLLGCQKCGTSQLYKRLISHGKILEANRLPSDPKAKVATTWFKEDEDGNLEKVEKKSRERPFIKELHFFDLETDHDVANYLAHFQYNPRQAPKGALTMDATPDYLDAKRSIPFDLRRTLKGSSEHAKFIIILRDPAERARSWFYMFQQKQYFALMPKEQRFAKWIQETEFPKCVKDKEWTDVVTACQSNEDWALAAGNYAAQLRYWLEAFPDPNHFLVLSFDEYTTNPNLALSRVSEFLDIEPFEHQELDEVVAHHYVETEEDDAAVAKARLFFTDMNNELRELLQTTLKGHSSPVESFGFLQQD